MGGRRKSSGKLRIIAGKWRRRQVQFVAAPGVRPTTDAAREFLFSWLQHHIEGSSCLDLFAGSGALGFEALSRGAKQVVLVDSERRCIENLHRNAQQLGAQHCTIYPGDALAYLRRSVQQFNIVFVDPPFNTPLAAKALRLLESQCCLYPGARVYLEVAREFAPTELADCWDILRTTRSGSRAHYLLALKSGNDLSGQYQD